MTAVLIVEDERGVREGLVTAVQRLGYTGVPAPGLDDARKLLLTEHFDCVLLDIRLRDGDGLDLLRELREGPHRDVPVIVATA
jgi:DNA-binding response OmpR family regulator